MNSDELFAKIDRIIDFITDPFYLSSVHENGYNSIFGDHLLKLNHDEFKDEVFRIITEFSTLSYSLKTINDFSYNLRLSKEWINNINYFVKRLDDSHSSISQALDIIKAQYGKRYLIENQIIRTIQGVKDYENPEFAELDIYSLLWVDFMYVFDESIDKIEQRIRMLSTTHKNPSIFITKVSLDNIRKSFDLLSKFGFIDSRHTKYKAFKGIFVEDSFKSKVYWKESKASLKYFIHRLTSNSSIVFSKKYVTASNCFKIHSHNNIYKTISNKDITGWQKKYNGVLKQYLDKACDYLITE